MSEVDPFVFIARTFPFKSALPVCEEDQPRLIQALMSEIAAQVEEKRIYENCGEA